MITFFRLFCETYLDLWIMPSFSFVFMFIYVNFVNPQESPVGFAMNISKTIYIFKLPVEQTFTG